MRRLILGAAVAVLVLGLLAFPRHLVSRVAVNPDFVHFESGHVHPATLTPSGGRLLVVNTPDNRLAVFDLTGAAPQRIADIPVGLEPVAVAAKSDSEAWVVNQLSDDVSIVNLNTLHVRATLRVGDEPQDVVFAGTPVRAYVSVSQEDRIGVYDPATLAAVASIAIEGRLPRALAMNAAGTKVYAAVLNAGNRTSVLSATEVPVDSMPSDPQFPRGAQLQGHAPPRIGLIVQQQGADWRDMYGKLWNYRIKYTQRDVDVAEISTASNAVTATFADLGAVNLGLAVSADGRVAVTGTEARNLQRLEPRLRGHVVDTQVGWVDVGGTTRVRNLNPHVNYGVATGTTAERDSALGNPTAVAFSGDGGRAYVTSLATGRLAVLDPAGDATHTVVARAPTVVGPTGVVVDDARGRIYVVGRFHNQVETLATSSLARVALTGIGFDPTPDAIVNGRKFFYGGFTSGHGDQACASCHVFGDMDNLAWDLGDPNGAYQPAPPNMIDQQLEGFDPEKGPMTTQSLRGLPNTGLLHWRGDRANLAAFNGAFVSLLGRTSSLPDSEMAAFSEFVLALGYPPNPAQRLDRKMPDAPSGQPSALRGQTFFMNTQTDGGVLRCNDCHTVPTGTNGQVVDDAALQEDQDIKIPQLRNLYKKTGFTDLPGAVNKRGSGFIHDGSVDNLFDFLQFPGFNFGANPTAANATRRDVEAFLLAFDTGMAPAVGYQITFTGTIDAVQVARLDTLRAQADSSNCDAIAKGRINGVDRGWFYTGGTWKPDVAADPPLTTLQLRQLGGLGREVTVSGVPLGSGQRMGIDRDRDTYLDGDERAAGSDPGDPASTPANVAVGPRPNVATALRFVAPNPFKSATEVAFTLARPGRVDVTIHDVLGREVRSLARGTRLDAGPQSLRWDGARADGRSAAAGVYFVRLVTDDGRWTRMVVRIR